MKKISLIIAFMLLVSSFVSCSDYKTSDDSTDSVASDSVTNPAGNENTKEDAEIVSILDSLQAYRLENNASYNSKLEDIAVRFVEALKSKDKSTLLEITQMPAESTVYDFVDKLTIESYELIPFDFIIKSTQEKDYYHAIVKINVSATETSEFSLGENLRIVSIDEDYFGGLLRFMKSEHSISAFNDNHGIASEKFDYYGYVNNLTHYTKDFDLGMHLPSELVFNENYHVLVHAYLLTLRLAEGDADLFNDFISTAFPGHSAIESFDADTLFLEKHGHGGTSYQYAIKDIAETDNTVEFVCDYFADMSCSVVSTSIKYHFSIEDDYPVLTYFEVLEKKPIDIFSLNF